MARFAIQKVASYSWIGVICYLILVGWRWSLSNPGDVPRFMDFVTPLILLTCSLPNIQLRSCRTLGLFVETTFGVLMISSALNVFSQLPLLNLVVVAIPIVLVATSPERSESSITGNAASQHDRKQ